MSSFRELNNPHLFTKRIFYPLQREKKDKESGKGKEDSRSSSRRHYMV
jgi:hypothetical protein